MISITINNQAIASNYVLGLSREYQQFDGSFFLGSTASASYTLTLSKEAGTFLEGAKMVIIDDTTTVATLWLESSEKVNNRQIKYTFTDGMTKFDIGYSAKEVIDQNGGSATLLQIVQNICSKAGVGLATQSFLNKTMQVSWYDNTITARQYLGYVAEANGGYAMINNLGKLEFKRYALANKTISAIQCSSLEIGDAISLSSLTWDDGINEPIVVGNSGGYSIPINTDNVFITDPQAQLTAIWNVFLPITIYGIAIDKCPQVDATPGTYVALNLNSTNYYFPWQFSQNFNMKWNGGVSVKLDSMTVAKKTSGGTVQNQIRRVKQIVDRQNNTISQLVEEVDGENGKVAGIEQSVENLTTYVYESVDGLTRGSHIEQNPNGVNIHSIVSFDDDGNPVYSGTYTNIANNGMTVYDENNEVALEAKAGLVKVASFQTGNWRMAEADDLGNHTLDFFYVEEG